jgi:hypothetical protein
MTVARVFVRYKFDLAGVQEVRWDKGGSIREDNYSFFYAVWGQERCIQGFGGKT